MCVTFRPSLYNNNCGISTTTVENSERDGNTRPPDLPPETYMQEKQQLEPDMEQQAPGSKLGKEYFKAVYCTLLV